MNMFSKKPKFSDESLVLAEAEPVAKDESTHDSGGNSILEIIRFSVIALLIVVPIRTFVAQPFIVSGASMAETFHTGEYLIVDQVSYKMNQPARGDVIVFRYPKDPSKFFIKRIIGLPGDTVIIDGTTVTIKNEANPDGLVLNEPYIKSMRPNQFLEEKLGEKEYFVMGDNRDESSDSRIWGVLQEDKIIGKAFLRLFPPSTIGVLPGAVDSEVISTIK